MAYPQTPWILQGYALQALQLVNVDRVRHLIPLEFNIISVWPGKTVGQVHLFYYGSGSVLEYSELIVVSGLVSRAGKVGGWISHIYVDNADSVAGGREIWGLPKELAEFTWTQGDRPNVVVRQGDKHLCSLSYSLPSFAWRQSLAAGAFSTLNSNLLFFNSKFDSLLSPVSSKLEVPAESPFFNLGLGQPWLTLYTDQLRLVVHAPQVVGKKAVEPI